jgi:hypothetical protein
MSDGWTPHPDEPRVQICRSFCAIDGWTRGYRVRYERLCPKGRRRCEVCGKAGVEKLDGKLHGHACDAAKRDGEVYRELPGLYGSPGLALAAVYVRAAHIRLPSTQTSLLATD